MLSINEAMGFVKQPAWIELEKTLRAPGATGEEETLRAPGATGEETPRQTGG
jgi:hypothetical protein